MARKLLAGFVSAAALVAVGTAAADQLPILRSARIVHRHLVLRLAVGDVRPTELTVAKRRAVDADGALLRNNVRLRESIQLPVSSPAVVTWRSHLTLRPGTYFVQVMATDSGGGGVTDCPPKQPNCNEHWSNVRRIVLPRSN
jgi:hypothetical protein